MYFSSDFDESNRVRRERIYKNTLRTANKLSQRIKHFLKDVNDNHSLTDVQKNEIKQLLKQ